MQLTHASRIKLGDDPPDFWLDFGRHEQAFEIVTLIPDGVRLGAQYDRYAGDLNSGQATPFQSRTEDQKRVDQETLPDRLATQLASKASKSYADGTILVVDILHEIYFERDTGPTQRLIDKASKVLNAFPEVWLRHGNSLVRISRYSASVITSPF